VLRNEWFTRGNVSNKTNHNLINFVNEVEVSKVFFFKMSRLLIGSSNVYRNYRATSFKHLKEYSMIKCLDLESLDAQLSNLEPNETEVVISVIENFLDKAAREGSPEERSDKLETVIKRYLGVVEDAATKNPGTKFLVVDPILRPKLEWYDEALEDIKAKNKEVFDSMGLNNTSRADVISRASQQFEKDGVHLTAAAGKIFVGGMLDAAEKFFRASFVDLASGVEDDNEDQDQAQGPTKSEIMKRIDRIEEGIEERKWSDNLLFARTREELDMAANKLKEDRVVITGLSSPKPPPQDRAQKNIWLRQLVMDTMKRIKPTFNGTIVFINQGKSNGRDIPMVEVKLNSVEMATTLRKAFAEKRKEGDGRSLGRLYVANSVSLSTRVRIDVMKALAKKLTAGNESAHVASYSSRPILHVKTTKPNGEAISRAYTFVDSIVKFGERLVQQDLEEAYKKAGSAFRGQMEQHFIVLRDQTASSAPPAASATSAPSAGSATAAGSSGLPRGAAKQVTEKKKRQRDEETEGDDQSDKRHKVNIYADLND